MLDGRDPELITCWTVQHQDVWRALQRGETHQADANRIESDLRFAYDWLCRETKKFLPGATGCYPIWAYARIGRADFRTLAAADSNDQEFLLTCRIPRERMVLSDYEAWHHVIGGWLLDPDYDDVVAAADVPTAGELWWDRVEAALGPTMFKQSMATRQWPPPYQAELEQSWRRIFDVQTSVKRWPNAIIQATFEELKPEDVVRAVPLTRPDTSPARRLANLIRHL